MTALWDLILSPTGLALYGVFWVVKLIFGAWVFGRAVALLPDRAQAWMQVRLERLRLMKRAR